MNSLKNWLAALGGANLEILRRTPRERDRFVAMALVLLGTAGLAVLSMSFALVDGLDATLPAAIPLAVLWGLLILNLDRFLVLNMGSTRSRRRLLAMAAPRLAVALVLGLVISTPLVLRVFAPEIRAQIQLDQARAGVQAKELLAQGQLPARQQELARQIREQESIAAGNPPDVEADPAVASTRKQLEGAQAQLAKAQQETQQAHLEMSCEKAGFGSKPQCKGLASNRAGEGPLYRQKLATYQQKVTNENARKADVARAQKALADARAAVLAGAARTAAERKKAAEDLLVNLRLEYQTVSEQVRQANERTADAALGNDGMLAQLIALRNLSEQDVAALLAHLGLGGLFVLIELLPVLVKILNNLGAESVYDTAVKVADETSNKVEKERSTVELALERDMRKWEKELGEHNNAVVAARMRKIYDKALKRWGEAAKQAYYAAQPQVPDPAAPGAVAASVTTVQGSASTVPDPNVPVATTGSPVPAPGPANAAAPSVDPGASSETYADLDDLVVSDNLTVRRPAMASGTARARRFGRRVHPDGPPVLADDSTDDLVAPNGLENP